MLPPSPPVPVPPPAAPNPPSIASAPRSFHSAKAEMKREEEPVVAPSSPAPVQEKAAVPEPAQEILEPARPKAHVRGIGVVFQTYILMEYKDQFILCDQHAAHERVLYERLLRETKQGPASQGLLVPRAVRVSHTQMAAFEENQALLTNIGFDLTPFGDDTLQLRGVPVVLGAPEAESCLTDTLDELSQYGRLDSYEKTLRIASTACRHAVKGGETVPMEELSWLIGQIMDGDMPPTCPHGRPLMITLSHTDLDRRFRRIQQTK